MLYPGRPNDDRGADFRDAVIRTANGLVKGDIEVHTRASDWRAHGHHKNPLYRRIVLHVVMWNDCRGKSGFNDGIPVLTLDKYFKPRGEMSDVGPDYGDKNTCGGNLTAQKVTDFLDDAGLRRFRGKASRFSSEIAVMDAGQCLYRGIMGALGYSKNSIAFMELAERVPLRFLKSVIQNEADEEECIVQLQAVLMGTAGLLPFQRQNHQDESGRWGEKLEEA